MSGGAEAFDQDITQWFSLELVESGSMFGGATQWLKKYKRTPMDTFNGGPPSAWDPI